MNPHAVNNVTIIRDAVNRQITISVYDEELGHMLYTTVEYDELNLALDWLKIKMEALR